MGEEACVPCGVSGVELTSGPVGCSSGETILADKSW